MVKFVVWFEIVQGQIDKIIDNLFQYEYILFKDIEVFDVFYEKMLIFYDELVFYIVVGEVKLKELDDMIILEKEVEVVVVLENEGVLKVQELCDLWVVCDDLECCVYDLKLICQVMMQLLLLICLVQENDKLFVIKINLIFVNIVLLWEIQLVQVVIIQCSVEVVKVVCEVNDLINELLIVNVENLCQVNKIVCEEMECGVFDIEVVKQVNEILIVIINESFVIVDEGKCKCVEVEVEFQLMEVELKVMFVLVKVCGDSIGYNVGIVIGE